MPNQNPSFPDVLGPEWLVTHDQKTRVFSGARGRMARVISTGAETVDALRLSANVNPQLLEDTYTILDIFEEGDEEIPLFERQALAPNSDVETNGWVTESGGTTDLHDSIDEAANRWGPASSTPARATWIENPNSFETYRCTVDASAFDTGGALENSRIGFVGVEAILGVDVDAGGYRKMRVTLDHLGTNHDPAGGNLRDVHAFGAVYSFWWGELNPATGLPWTPADIANFDIGGDWTIQLRSQSTTSTRFPLIYAVALNVHTIPTENRVAVGVWRRPEDGSLDDRLVNITTDDLVTMPSGAANWSKADATNYLVYWRQSVAPALFGAVNADDVRWNGAFQELGPGGEPPGIVFPLHSDGIPPAPSNVQASAHIAYDQFGRPEEAFSANSRAAYGLALMVGGSPSVDSQPYRMDLADVVTFNENSGVTGQRFTPVSSQDYLGFRLPIIPPFADAELTVTIHESGTGTQVGGSFTITALDVGRIAHTNRVRYLTGFLDAGASLTGATQYEVRLTSTSTGAGADDWIVFAPDCSLAPEASFGGATDGAMIEGIHETDRDMSVNLIKQPDPPQNVAAAIVNVPVTTSVGEVTTVEHVDVTWDAPASSMGAQFSHYELERMNDAGEWERIANIRTEATLSREHHEAPRDTESTYRIRAVGAAGRISQWVQSNGVTPTAPGSILILTSDHDPSLELVHFYERESTYPLLSTERDESIAIHGSNNQVVFMESEDRGIGWKTIVTLNQVVLAGRGGLHVLTPLIDLIRSLDVPYVCVMDHQGTRILGHVRVQEATQNQPAHRYRAEISVTPTHDVPVPVEVV